MFSVVIPLYNKATYVADTIQSVIDQSYTNFEIIVVDDGSADEGPEIVGKITDTRIRLVKQSNSGVSSARNRGINESRFQYIAFLDADDCWCPNFLESIVSLINDFPGYGCYATSFNILRNGTLQPHQSVYKFNNTICLLDLFEYSRIYNTIDLPIHTSCFVYNKSHFNQMHYFNEKCSFYEDYDFMMRLNAQSKIIFNPIPQSIYNNDVPNSGRLGWNPPSLDKHWVSYIDVSFPDSADDSSICRFVSQFKLKTLSVHALIPKDRGAVRKIVSTIPKKNIPLKMFIFYHTPFVLSSFFLKLNLLIKKIHL